MSVNGQYQVIKCGRITGDDGENFVLSDSLYSSCFNRIFIETNDVPFEDIELTADSVQIIKHNGIHPGTKDFYAKIIGHPDNVIFKVYAFKRLIDSVPLIVVRDLPHLSIKLCGELLGFDGIKKWPRQFTCLKVEDKLELYNDTAQYHIKFKVLSFLASIERNGKVIYEENNCGNYFSDLFNIKAKNSKENDAFLIKSIVVMDEENGNIYNKYNQYLLKLQ